MTEIAILLGANSETAGVELQDVIKFEMKLANVRSTILFCQRFKKKFYYSGINARS